MSEQVEQSNELAVIPQANVMTVFTTAGSLDPILAKIAEEVRAAKFDPYDAKDRKAIASLAFKVAKTKTYIDGLGKKLNDELKGIPKKVDQSRKQAWDFLEALQKEARKPLDDWEAEQARIAEENRLRIESEAAAKQLEADHELGLLMNDEFDRELEAKLAHEKAEAERIEKERIAREEAIAAEASRKAKEQAEAEAKRREDEAKALAEKQLREQREAAERAEREAKELAEKKLREQKEATERAERQAREAEEAKERERLASIEREKQAVERERQRQESERLAAEEESRKREANKKHCAAINNQAMQALVDNGFEQELAKSIIVLIAKGEIPNVSIRY